MPGPAERGPARMGPGEMGPGEMGPVGVGPVGMGPVGMGPAEMGAAPMLERLAERLESAADTLTKVDRALPVHAVAPGAFGADDEGAPGRLGRQLHEHWQAVLAARSREAADTAARLTGLAADLRTTAKGYAETDDEVGRRIRRGM